MRAHTQEHDEYYDCVLRFNAPSKQVWSSIMNMDGKMRSQSLIVDRYQIWNNYLCVIIDGRQITVVIRAVRLRRLNGHMPITMSLIYGHATKNHIVYKKQWTAKSACVHGEMIFFIGSKIVYLMCKHIA